MFKEEIDNFRQVIDKLVTSLEDDKHDLDNGQKKKINKKDSFRNQMTIQEGNH